MTLTEFLTARLDEDERWWEGADLSEEAADRFAPWIVMRKHIVEAHGGGPHPCKWGSGSLLTNEAACKTLRLLALPYADHPDYDEEWKP